jgi:trans-L-3-hydroxyproline dehydratase
MNLEAIGNWQPPAGWTRITAIDAHTGGEPLRIYLDGFPTPEGDSILARRRDCLARLDHLRTATMWEPRGHADMYGCLVVPPEREDSDFGVLFTHNEGYSSMCGHGIVAVVTVMLETGVIPLREGDVEVRIDAPAGLIVAWAEVADGEVQGVRFDNVPSFAALLDAQVSVPGLGTVNFDLAYGGAFYAFVDAASIALDTAPENITEMIDVGRRIKYAVIEQHAVEHPFDEDLSFLYGTIFTDAPRGAGADTRNVCIFADGEVDRSPTGTGVSARLAIAAARNDLAPGEPRVYESVIGSQFVGRIGEALDYGPHRAIVPQVRGQARICGRQEFLIDPRDTLGHGFLLR